MQFQQLSGKNSFKNWQFMGISAIKAIDWKSPLLLPYLEGIIFWRAHLTCLQFLGSISLEWLIGFYRKFIWTGLVYIEDAVIYGENVDTSLKNLDLVLDCMVRFNIRLKPKKIMKWILSSFRPYFRWKRYYDE
jgi:hypothetical protein